MSSDRPAAFPVAGKTVWVAGHRGMVGSAVVRRLAQEDCRILTVDRGQVDLRRQAETEDWIRSARPDAVIIAAATVGGILANDTRPAEFLYDNLAIEGNIIHGAWRSGVGKVLFLGSSCIYPKLAPQPIPEEALLTGPLEPTNEWYAIAKIAGIKLCQAYRRQYGADFISAQPTNLYGPHDNFDLTSSHVVPALMAKAERARRQNAATMEVWGTGSPRREFLYVDDLADALVFLLQHYSDPMPINVGTGHEVTIRALAETITRVVGFQGTLVFDHSKPDGTPRKLVSTDRLRALGWRSRTTLEAGLAATYAWFRDSEAHIRSRPAAAEA
jgi:GDP-L-fucose synthase